MLMPNNSLKPNALVRFGKSEHHTVSSGLALVR